METEDRVTPLNSDESSIKVLTHQLEVLAKENATLRGQISLSESEKLLQTAFTNGVLQLRNEFAEEHSIHGTSIVHSDTNSSIVALEEQCKKNLELDRRVSELESEILPPLRIEVDRLVAECEKLRKENTALREGETSQTLLLEQQLKCSQEAEMTLRNDLDSLRSQSSVTSQFVGATLRRLVDAIENVRADILVAGDKAAVVNSLERRHQQTVLDHASAIQAAIKDAQLSVESVKVQSNFLTSALDESSADISNKLVAIRLLEEGNNKLKARIVEMEAEGRSFDMPTYQDLKRRRLEVDSTAQDFVSRRRELIEFWFDGHEKIEFLEKEAHSARMLNADLHNARAELLAHRRDRSVAVESVVALSDEVERLRAELVQARSRALGLESENEILVRELSKLVASQLSAEEISVAANSIRIAGEQAAAATIQSVVDPVALQEALQRSQEIRQEIHQLAQRRDELLQCIQLRETRLTSLDATILQYQPTTPLSTTSLDQETLLSELDTLRMELATAIHEKHELAHAAEIKVNDLHDLLEAATAKAALQQLQLDASFFTAQSAVSIANCTSTAVIEQLGILDRQYTAIQKMSADAMLASPICQSNVPQPNDLGTICNVLANHIQFMKEAVETESRRHSVHETEYILALLKELRNNEAMLSTSKQKYDEGLNTLHNRLAHELEAVKSSWSTSLGHSLSSARSDLAKIQYQLLSNPQASQQPQLSIAPHQPLLPESSWDQRALTIADCTATLSAQT
ncbi:Hypothetical protein, putative [Bodo saltans]|uniref:Uncharacterized protein n=1 Tax=Bodo saltans TaxID=75058 RepID=A0A0S4IQU7_BODSA|nr:Hypothetical protein, putative [Bodo saltans]|eukprot:CUF98913.1 Hypothetical protein, putative [Bodo saltans]